MQKNQTIRRNLALKEIEIKETSDGIQVTFSIKFVKKNGELVIIPRAVASGLPFNGKITVCAVYCRLTTITMHQVM